MKRPTTALLGLLLLTAPRPRSAVTWVEPELPSTLHPLWAASALDRRAQAPIYDSLAVRGPEGWTVPMAQSVESESGSIVIALRRDLKWHDGERLTGVDVCATIDALRSTRRPTPLGSRIRTRLQHCATVADDPWMVRVRMADTSDAYPLGTLAFPVLPAHLGDLTDPAHPIATAPVGSGPWAAQLQADGVRYTPRPSAIHEGSRPELRLVVEPERPMNPDRGMPVIPPGRLDEARSVDGWTLHPYPLRTVIMAWLDTTEPPLSRPEAREELDQALDRALICQGRSLCKPTVSPFGSHTRATNHSVSVPTRRQATSLDPLAVAIVAELELDAEYLGRKLVEQWAPHPVHVEVLPLAELFAMEHLQRRERYDVVVAARTPASEDLGPDLGLTGDLNWFKVVDPQVQQRLAARSPGDLRTLHAIVADQRPVIPLVELDAMAAWPSHITPAWMTPMTGLDTMGRWGLIEEPAGRRRPRPDDREPH